MIEKKINKLNIKKTLRKQNKKILKINLYCHFTIENVLKNVYIVFKYF
jgi:hypothetical protein